SNLSCNGNDGSISIDAKGGVPTYFYRVDGGTFQTSATLGGLTAGAHNLSVRDSKGCNATISNVVVGTAAPLSAGLQSKTNVSCAGGSDGSITMRRTTANGGISPWMYSINNGGSYQSGFTFTGL